MLLNLYASHAWPIDASKTKLVANGRPINGHVPGHSSDSRVRDAEEFELEGLMSDEDGQERPVEGRRKENGAVP